jgi:eukaryotic-like serine/threonine-protein kinase
MAAGALFFTFQQRDSGSVWRMEIAVGNTVGEGCTVTLTNSDTGERRSFEGVYGTVSHQLLDQGRWTWTVSDPRCVVTEKSGAGAVTLPFVQRAGVGDSDAFRPDGPISVTMLDDPNGGTSCDLELRSVKTGKILAFRTVVQGGPPATLDPAAEAQVYIASNYCSFRAAPSR